MGGANSGWHRPLLVCFSLVGEADKDAAELKSDLLNT